MDVEPFGRMAKTSLVGEATVGIRPVHLGPRDGMYEQMSRSNWEPTRNRAIRLTKKIRRRMEASCSDEAILSCGPAGQHNWLVSKGPLDGIGWTSLGPRAVMLARCGPVTVPQHSRT